MSSIINVNGRWRAQVRRKGFRPFTQTFATKAQADAWARRIEAMIDDGRSPDGRTVLGRRYLVADAIDDYRDLRDSVRPISDSSNEHYSLNRLRKLLGGLDAATMTVDDLISFARVRADDGAGPYTVNMDIGKLGTVLRLVSGAKRLNLPDTVAQARPVLSHLGLIGGGGKRERRPDEDELSGLLPWMENNRGQVYADFIRFAILTAMRRAEVARLVWSDVDAARKMVMVRDRKHPRQKKGNDEWIPLLGGAWELVQRQPKGNNQRIFPVHPQTISKYFREACQALGIPDLQLRDMRHDGVSRLFEQGYQIQEVALVSGHKKWETLKRYTNLRPEQLHAGPRSGADRSTPPRP